MNDLMKTFSLTACVSILALGACDDRDIEAPANEEELITTVSLEFTEVGSIEAPLVFQWRDVDGSGNPEIDDVVLTSGKTYQLRLGVLDESVAPAENIAEEILEEGDAHQFFFETDIAGIAFDYDDADDNGKPIGLECTVTTTASGIGELLVVLRHELDKSGAGVAEGDLRNAGGETDIEITFPLRVED